MKLFQNWIWTAFAVATALCAALASPVPAMAEANRYASMADLKAQTADRWRQTYQTVRNETVFVDCAVSVPEAQKAPVLRVHWYPSIDPSFKNDFDPDSWAKQECTVIIKNWQYMIPYAMQPKDYQYIQTFIPLDQVEWDKAYCENSDLTPRNAFAALQGVFQSTFQKYGTEGSYLMQPSYGITIARLEDNEGNCLWDKEIYQLTAYEVIRDIPILGLIRNNYPGPNAYGFEDVYWPRYYALDIAQIDSYSMGATIAAEEAVLYDDIPLVGFETVKPQIEKQIQAGKMRTVYQVQLGYMTFLEPDHNLKRYVLVPAWVVDCEYFDSAKEDASEVDALSSDNYTENYRHRQIVFNAQTGNVIDPENTARSRSDAPQILTWDDVR